AQRVRKRLSSRVREGCAGVPRAERTRGSLMSWRRVVFAFAITFVCALAVFTLPRFVFNTVSGAVRQTPAQDTAKARPAPPAPLHQQPTAPVQPSPRSLGSRLTGLFGIILILAIGIAFSRNRRAISWRVVAWGVGLQAVFAIFVLRIPIGQEIFSWLGATVTKILSFSYAGSEFVFGEIGKQHSSIGVVFAFQIMPAIIFVSALFAIMYYLGIMQIVVKAFAVAMNKIMGASGAESLKVDSPRTDVNVLDAAARGTSEGLFLMLNVIAMLISFIALIALVNGLLGWIHGFISWFPISLQTVLGWIFRPIAFVMGVPWHD